jgi:aminoglycoside phosphotransferase (APT) family kinase protein
MTMTLYDQKFRQLVQQLAPDGKLQHSWPLTGGLSAKMIAFTIEYTGGQTRKLIWRSYDEGQLEANSASVAREFQLLQIVQALALAAPAPHALDLSGEIFPAPYLLIEYIEGQMIFAPADRDTHLRQLATHLAQIHGADYTSFDLSFLPERGNDCAEMGQKRPVQPRSSPDEDRIRHTLASLWPFSQRNSSTLLHGDYWPGNTLWQNGQLVAVIDWEDAEWGDPLIDLARSRSEIVWIFGVEAMNTFTHYYQSLMPLDITHLPYWDLCAALRFIRLFGHNLAEAGTFFLPFGRDDITEQAIRENFNHFLNQAYPRLNLFPPRPYESSQNKSVWRTGGRFTDLIKTGDTEMKDIDESQFVHKKDLEGIYAQTDPNEREAMLCSITTYRSPNKLNVGDTIPHTTLTSLETKQKVDLRTLAEERPLVLFFGSYT